MENNKPMQECLENMIKIFSDEMKETHTEKQAKHMEHIKEAYEIYQEKYKVLTGHFYKTKDI